MWIYKQSTGALARRTWLITGTPYDVAIGTGYSGYAQGLNNPELESMPFVGPIPKGLYGISPMYTHKADHIGERLRLTPFGHRAHGRSGFLIHGDNSTPEPSDASRGCIILAKHLRDLIATSADNTLSVE